MEERECESRSLLESSVKLEIEENLKYYERKIAKQRKEIERYKEQCAELQVQVAIYKKAWEERKSQEAMKDRATQVAETTKTQPRHKRRSADRLREVDWAKIRAKCLGVIYDEAYERAKKEETK